MQAHEAQKAYTPPYKLTQPHEHSKPSSQN